MSNQNQLSLAQSTDSPFWRFFQRNVRPMCVYDARNLKLMAVNKSMAQFYGYSEAEMLCMTLANLWPTEYEFSSEFSSRPEQTPVTYCHVRKDASWVHVEVTVDEVNFLGQPMNMLVSVDASSRLQAEHALARVNRAQSMLSSCNDALLRANAEDVLLQDICRIAVESGGYLGAWVGFARHDEAHTIERIAFCGVTPSYVHQQRTSWSEDVPEGRGAAGRTIRSGNPVIVDDIRKPENFRPWGKGLEDAGVRGLISLPLINGETTFGVLLLYSSEVVNAAQDEIKLLQGLANDLAFGICNLRAQEKQRRFQTTVLKVAAAVSVHSGLEFLAQLALNICEALGAQAAFIARRQAGEPPSAKTLVAAMDGHTLQNFEYPIESMPCDALYAHRQWVVNGDLASDYPRATMPFQMNFKAYAGQRLDDTQGEAIGHIFVLFHAPLEDQDFVLSILQIFAARVTAEMQRQLADARIREQAELLDKAQDAIILRDLVHGVVYWNHSAERLYGWTAKEAHGNKMADRLYKDQAEFQENLSKLMASGAWKGEVQHLRKDGSVVEVESHWTLVYDEMRQPKSVLSINTDITTRKTAERKIYDLAFYDQLTRLPNRLLLMERLKRALESSKRSGQYGALLFIDLDNFKALNDTLGHESGDMLLAQVAARLLRCVHQAETIARFGGDEFVVILEGLSTNEVESAQLTLNMCEGILAALAAPYELNGLEQNSTSCIGIAPFGKASNGETELLKQADLALYQAKTSGRNTIQFFNSTMQDIVTARVKLELDMRLALARNEFLLHYQPQFDATNRMIGVEALVRWQHPQRGLVSPAEFIPVAEETSIILPLGKWVLHAACKQLKDWQQNSATSHLTMAVNVSAKQFRHPDFVQQVIDVVRDVDVDARRLKLELTESLLADDLDLIISKMSALRMLNLHFSLDDFGTGYSSLSYLKRLPLEQLKIDQSFVRDIISDANDASIVTTIITLGQSLGLSVIAEGVETDAQRDFLAAHGCLAYQGYLFSRALPAADLQRFLCSINETHS